MPTARHQMQIIHTMQSGWSPPTYGDAQERIRLFVKATSPYADDILTQALDNFVEGRVAGHNAAYMPTPAQFGTECLRLANLKAESDERTRRYTYKALPEPERQPVTPESRARVMAMIDEFLHRPDQDPIPDRGRAFGARTAAEIDQATAKRFRPSDDPHETEQRLMRRHT
jgi:hypothetical protein